MSNKDYTLLHILHFHRTCDGDCTGLESISKWKELSFECVDSGKFLMTKTMHLLRSSTTALERGACIFSFTSYLIKDKFVEEDYESVPFQSIRALKQEKTSVHKHQSYTYIFVYTCNNSTYRHIET